ncbi:MAG: tryptophan--tRNA ligase [Patescibacteria group bacterium]
MVKRILTGMRTTGRLHLGHYVGALENWIRLQHEYDCYFLLADVQALTTHFDRVEGIEDSVRQVVTDWLSVGLDAEHSSFVLQSYVREYYELTQLLSFMVSMGSLQRNPTLKQEIKNLGMGDVNVGFMTYPISQASDILLFSPQPYNAVDELLIPVGEDQIPHIEDTRDIARRFNNRYGTILTLPTAKVGDVPRLGDLAGGSKKMGKSYGNAIYLSDPPNEVEQKVRAGFTDPKKLRKGDPGDPSICPIYSYHEIFRADGAEETAAGCRSGALGCAECKRNLAKALNAKLDPIREKRLEIEQKPELVSEAISTGTKRARAVGQPTIEAVRSAMHIDYPTLNME